MVVREKYRGYSAAGISWYSATVDLHNNNNTHIEILAHVPPRGGGDNYKDGRQ